MEEIKMLEWMFWTRETLIFLAALITFFIILAVLDLKWRSEVPRKGFLPIATTRGDRVFLGLAAMIIIGILWLKTPFPMRYAIIPGLAAFIIILLRG
jgi:predicted small integral membrane protein